MVTQGAVLLSDWASPWLPIYSNRVAVFAARIGKLSTEVGFATHGNSVPPNHSQPKRYERPNNPAKANQGCGIGQACVPFCS
jgi:hypothetical protein